MAARSPARPGACTRSPGRRSYLVRAWTDPTPPPDDLRPRSKEEGDYWNKWIAEGWAKGERQAVEIFLSDLGRLDRDIVGMARYRVLLRAGLVEQPKVTFANRSVEGGRDKMRVDDRTITITNQPGLNPNRRNWRGGLPEMRLPSDTPADGTSSPAFRSAAERLRAERPDQADPMNQISPALAADTEQQLDRGLWPGEPPSFGASNLDDSVDLGLSGRRVGHPAADQHAGLHPDPRPHAPGHVARPDPGGDRGSGQPAVWRRWPGPSQGRQRLRRVVRGPAGPAHPHALPGQRDGRVQRRQRRRRRHGTDPAIQGAEPGRPAGRGGDLPGFQAG